MHDVLGVCGIQCFGDLDSEFQNDVDLQQRSVEPTPKCLALEQLHHDEGLALVLIDLVDRADVRMVQGCRGAGFPKKAAKRGLVARRLGRKELDCYGAIELRVFSPIDDPHAAVAELLQDAVVGNGFVDQVG